MPTEEAFITLRVLGRVALTPRILRETVEWLDNEVFLQVDDGNGADVNKEQEEYEKALYDQILEAKNNN